MANSKQAEKRARQNKARYKLRHSQRSQTRTAVKAVRYAIEENDAAKASDLLKTCLLYTSPSPRDVEEWRLPSSA